MCIVCVLMDWHFLLHIVIVDGITGQSVCAACLNVIHDEEFLEALSKEWHIDCFRYFSFAYLCLLFSMYSACVLSPVWFIAVLFVGFLLHCQQ